jgi:hypothetical protein
MEHECIAREPTLEKYIALIRRIDNHFKGFTTEYNERKNNTEADELANAAACNTLLSANVFFLVIEIASVKTVEPEPRLTNAIEGED